MASSGVLLDIAEANRLQSLECRRERNPRHPIPPMRFIVSGRLPELLKATTGGQ